MPFFIIDLKFPHKIYLSNFSLTFKNYCHMFIISNFEEEFLKENIYPFSCIKGTKV